MSCSLTRLPLVALSSFVIACAENELPTSPTQPVLMSSSPRVPATNPVSAQSLGEAEAFIFPFHDCVGPSGTPESFDAVKTELADAAYPFFAPTTAYRLTDGSAIFLALIRPASHPPGIDAAGIAIVSCLVDTPRVGTVAFSGFFAPAP